LTTPRIACKWPSSDAISAEYFFGPLTWVTFSSPRLSLRPPYSDEPSILLPSEAGMSLDPGSRPELFHSSYPKLSLFCNVLLARVIVTASVRQQFHGTCQGDCLSRRDSQAPPPSAGYYSPPQSMQTDRAPPSTPLGPEIASRPFPHYDRHHPDLGLPFFIAPR